MGNVLEAESLDSVAEDDKWMKMSNSNILNDSYISTVYDTLPKFLGTDLVKVKRNEVCK